MTVSVEFEDVNPRALAILFGRNLRRRIAAAAQQARDGHHGPPAPVLRNRRRGWRHG